MKEAFEKLRGMYSQEELKVADEILEKVVQKEKEGGKLMATPYIEANRQILYKEGNGN